jgi:hypothetical protein
MEITRTPQQSRQGAHDQMQGEVMSDVRTMSQIETELAEAHASHAEASGNEKAQITRHIKALEKELETLHTATPEPKPRAKAPILHVADVDWTVDSETGAKTHEYEGYLIAIDAIENEKGKVTGWAYVARIIATGEEITSGTAKSEGGAMRSAANAVNLLVRDAWKTARKAEREAARSEQTDGDGETEPVEA